MLHKEELQFWIDLNLPRSMATWLTQDYGVTAYSFAELGFENVSDVEVFKKALQSNYVIIITTKDIDFIYLSHSKTNELPKILHMNIGNVTNTELKNILKQGFDKALKLFLEFNKTIVEISN